MKETTAQLISTVGTILTFVSILGLLLILWYYYRQKQKYTRRLNESLEANQLLITRMELQEQTLHLFGQELHDNIGQLLGTTKMFLGLAEGELQQVPQPFNTAKDALTKAIKELRALSKSFNRQWLNQFDLFENLQQEANRINSGGSIAVNLFVDPVTLPISSESQIMIFRIVQEAIQNSVKHAQPTQLTISVKVTESLVIIVGDNGVGFDINNHSGKGVGTLNMRNRAELLGGHIKWNSMVGTGTNVVINIPLPSG